MFDGAVANATVSLNGKAVVTHPDGCTPFEARLTPHPRDGVVDQVGTSLKLYDDPDNQFVAGFLGSSKMNFLQGTVEGQNLRLSTYGDQTIALDNLAEKLNDGDNITAGIPPEHFKRGGDAVLNVTAELIEHLGGETYAYARHKGGDMLTVATDDRRELTAGSELKAHYENKDVLFFDIRGQRLR